MGSNQASDITNDLGILLKYDVITTADPPDRLDVMEPMAGTFSFQRRTADMDEYVDRHHALNGPIAMIGFAIDCQPVISVPFRILVTAPVFRFLRVVRGRHNRQDGIFLTNESTHESPSRTAADFHGNPRGLLRAR